MVDAKGVSAKGGMGVFVIKGPCFWFLFVPAALSLGSGRSGQFKGVVIQVSGRRWKLVPGGAGVELIVRVYVI
jgi:hypothetical protein